jgi:HEAT repeat protein
MSAADVNTLIAQLSSSDASRQAAAAEALAHLGGDAQPAAAALVRACGNADSAVRDNSVAALEDLGPPPPGQIADLIQLSRDSSTDVAYWAITLLGRGGEQAVSSVPTLAQLLCSEADIAVRERAAWALGKIGPPAAAARPALRQAAASDSPRLSRLAKNALEALDG